MITLAALLQTDGQRDDALTRAALLVEEEYEALADQDRAVPPEEYNVDAR